MKQTKHIWWTFSVWEADALRQYLEQLALEGWYPESIGGGGMKCYRADPEKRRYAAVLAPKTSVLTGADSWDAGKFRERCEAAGWKFQCSGINWQIFYTTDETLERTEEMSDANQFLIQKTLAFGWSTRILYPLIVVLQGWLLYQGLRYPAETMADPWSMFSGAVCLLLIFSYGIPYLQLIRWVRSSEHALRERGKLPVIDLKRRMKSKKRMAALLFGIILLFLILAFSTSVHLLVTVLTSSLILCGSACLVLSWIRKHGSGDQRENWIGYLVGVTALCMILVPLSGALTGHLIGNEEESTNVKQTVFATWQSNTVQADKAGNPVVVNVYKSQIPWIIQKTRQNYPKDLTKLWDCREVEVPEVLSTLPDGAQVSWYRYYIRNETENGNAENQSAENQNVKNQAAESEDARSADTKSGEVIAADERTAQELQKEQDVIKTAEAAATEAYIALDEVVLSDENRLVILDYGGGTDADGVEEAVQGFLEPVLK